MESQVQCLSLVAPTTTTIDCAEYAQLVMRGEVGTLTVAAGPQVETPGPLPSVLALKPAPDKGGAEKAPQGQSWAAVVEETVEETRVAWTEREQADVEAAILL